MTDDVSKRSECWSAILSALYRTRRLSNTKEDGTIVHDGFQLQDVYEMYDLADKDISYATLRRTARDMQEREWLERESEKAKTWRRGPRAAVMLSETGVDIELVLERLGMTEEELFEAADEQGFV